MKRCMYFNELIRCSVEQSGGTQIYKFVCIKLYVYIYVIVWECIDRCLFIYTCIHLYTYIYIIDV